MVERRRTSRELTLSAAEQVPAACMPASNTVRLDIACYVNTIEEQGMPRITPRIIKLCLWLALMAGATSFGQQRGIVLADLTWMEAEKALTPGTGGVIPLGAGDRRGTR